MLLSFSSKVKASTRQRLEITSVKGIVSCAYYVVIFVFCISFFRFDCSAHLHSIICCLLLQMYRGLSVCVCLLVTRVTLAKCLNHLRCHLGCLLVEAQATFIRWGPRFPTGKGTFGALYLGMPRLLCGRIPNLMCQGVAAMWPLATSTVAVCFTGLLVVVVVAVAVAATTTTVRHGTGSFGSSFTSGWPGHHFDLVWDSNFPVFKKMPRMHNVTQLRDKYSLAWDEANLAFWRWI